MIDSKKIELPIKILKMNKSKDLIQTDQWIAGARNARSARFPHLRLTHSWFYSTTLWLRIEQGVRI